MKVNVSLGLVGCLKTTEIEVEDDCSDTEIEEMARSALFDDLIEWGWNKVPPASTNDGDA